MKKQLLYLLPLFALCLGAVSIKWFNDYPAGRPLTTNDIVAIQRTGPNRYVYGDLNDVKNSIWPADGAGMLTNNGTGTKGYMPIPSGGAAQLWTNELSNDFNSNPTNIVRLGYLEQFIVLGHTNVFDADSAFYPVTISGYTSDDNDGYFTAGFTEVPPLSTTPPTALFWRLDNVSLPYPTNLIGAQTIIALNAIPTHWTSTGIFSGNEFHGSSAIVGVSSTTGSVTNGGEAVGVFGIAKGNETYQIGVLGLAGRNQFTVSQTNIGVAGVIQEWTNENVHVAGYFALNPTTNAHPKISSSAVFADTGTNTCPLFNGATNHGVIVASLGSSGVWTNQGTVCLSNSSPAIPTAAALRAGGFWTGNSNGFLVTVYSLDGSTTVMKVLAP